MDVLRLYVRRGLLDDYAATDMLTWQAAGGFSLDASVRVEGDDRAGRERLWARLLARIYEVFPLICLACGSELRIIACLTDPEPVNAFLEPLGLCTRPPPLAPARAPPELEFDFDLDLDQTPAFDPSEPEPTREFEFDQRHGA